MSNLLKRKSFEKENSKAFFYTISEFSNLTKLSKHTIRNLENEYGLEISRDAKGNRIYNENDVEQFQKIYFAKDSYSRTTNSKSSQLQNYDKSTSIDGDVKQPLVFGFDSLKKGVNNTEYIQKDTKKIPRPATKVSLNYSNMYAFPVIAIMFFAFIFLNNIESYLKDLTNSRLFSTQDLSSRNTSVLQSTAEIFENRFDVNIPSNFSLPSTFEDTVEVVGTSNFIGNASFRSISVGEIQITTSGIFAPNLVNLLSLSPEEKNLLLDTTTPNNPVLYLKTNLDLSKMTTDNAVIDTLEVSSIQGLSQLDEESIQTIEDSITFPTDAETLNGLSSDNFLRSNTNTVFTGGTFDISSGSIFNATSGSSIVLNSGSSFQVSSGSTFKLSSVPPNSNLKVDSSGNLSYFTFSEGDVSPVTTSNSVSFNLNTVNTNPGTFGSASQIPVLTVDEKGRVTGVTTVVNPSAGSSSVVTNISFSTPQPAFRTFTLERTILENLSTTFSLGSIDITTALNYTPLNKEGDTMSGPLLVLGNINSTQNISSLNLTSSFGSFTTLSTGTLTLTNPLSVIYGGTGQTSNPLNGQLLIGNGTGYTLSTLTAGSNVQISNASGYISISATDTDTDTNFYPTTMTVTGTNTKTITLSGVGMGSVIATFSDIGGGDTNPNNFVTGISFSGSNAQRTLTLNRDGLSSLTTSFSLSSSDITTALNYTPLNKAGDTMSGPLLIQGNLSITDEGTVSAKVLRQNGNEVCDTSLNCDGLGTGLSGSGSSGFIPTFVSSRGLANSIIYQINSKIGINKTNPSATLDIEGSVQASTTIASATLFQNGYQVCDASGNCPSAGVGLSGSGIAGYLSYFNSSSGLSSSTIFQSGSNIGLGTTSPTSKLEILGATKTTSLIVTNTSSIGTLTLTNPLAIIYGGTGLTQTPTVGQILFGNSSSSYSLGTISQGTGIQVSTSPTGFTISSTVVDTTNPNNFVTGIAFSGSNSQRTLTIDRQGLSSLTTSFSLASSDITTALNYTPLSKAGDTMSGPLLVQSSINSTGNISSSTTISAPSLIQNGSLVCDTSGNCSGLNGTVLGSGTTNYLPVFTSTNSLANSVIYQIGGNVGIGTTSLSNTLQVSGTIGAVSFSGSGVNLISLPAVNLFGTVSGNLGVTSGSASSSFVTYNGTSSTSGQFDGGNTTPIRDTRLNYNGYFYATRFYGNGANLTSLTAGNLSGTIPSSVLGSSSLFVGTTEITLNRSSSALSLTGITGITSTTSLNLSAGGSNQNIILSPSGTGRVGVNNTNPQYTLDVTGSLNATQVYINGSLLSAGASAWDVLGSNIYRMTGNVGIGTSTPGTALEVSGRILASGTQGFIQSPYEILAPRGFLYKGAGTLTSIGTTPSVASPWGLVIDPSGRFAYVPNYYNNTVQSYKIDQTTGSLTSIGTTSTGVNPSEVAMDPLGRFVLVLNLNMSTIQSYTIDHITGSLTSVGTTSTGITPSEVVIDPTGRFAFVTNYSNNNVQSYTIDQTTGSLTSVGTASTGNSPEGVAIDPSGRFAFVVSRDRIIRSYRIDQTTGSLTWIGDISTSSFSDGALYDVAVDPSGRFVFVVDINSDFIYTYTINQNTGTLTAVASVSTGTRPNDLAFDPSGHFIFVTNQGNSTVGVFTLNQVTGVLTSVGSYSTGSLAWKVAVNPSGNYAYVVNRNANNVQTYIINNLSAGSGFFAGNLNIYNPNESPTLTNFTQSINNAGVLITNDYQANTFTSGVFWNNPLLASDSFTRPKAGIFLNQDSGGSHMYLRTSQNFNEGLNTGANVGVTINPSGNVGIGTTSVDNTHRLRVIGTAGLSTGTAWTTTSDSRFKNIESSFYNKNILENIMNLKPIKYKWNNLHSTLYGSDTSEFHYGFVAQEVESIFPEMVTTDDEGYKWYNPSGFEAILTKGIQEQQTQISTLSHDSLTLSSVSTNLSSAMQSLVTSSSNLESVNGNLSLAMNNLISTQASFELRLNNFSNALGNITMTQSEFSLSLNTLNLKQEELSTALGSLNLTTFQSMYDSLQNTLDALTMDTLNGELVISSDLLVNGDSIFNNATFTGDVSIGQMSFNTLDNSLNVLGASCVNLDNTLDDSLCTSQTLYVMKNTSGYIDFFDGQITFKPNGDLEVKRVVAQEVQASEYKVASTSEISGTGIINSGDLEILILSDKVKSNSKIFVTATTDLKGKSLFVAEKISEISFKVKLNEISDADIHFDWFILNME